MAIPSRLSDDDQIKIDVIAIQTAFATLPTDPGANNGDIVSGKSFTTQPVFGAQNDAGQTYTYQPRVPNENNFPLSFSLVTSPQLILNATYWLQLPITRIGSSSGP